ncbi:MAG: patatin-like phospholipase family protein [Thermoguttaceae bacterium]
MRSRCDTRWIAIAAVLLSGCAATRQYPAPPILPPTAIVEIGKPADNGPYDASQTRVAAAKPRNVLVLSGGGANGAYVAGVLKGWTASGTRPQFDVVTGVSTGALIAPLAFLGPEYDGNLERLYTSMRQENIIRPRLLWLDSLVSSQPLEQQIAACVTPDILSKIAEAHRQGRRLYVGTTNLDTKSLVVWDLGAIAARNTPESKELFKKVLLASCSVPGLLPPAPIDVEIDGQRFTELHVDGGVTACVFLQPAMLGVGPRGELPPNAGPLAVHVLVAGRLQQPIAPTKRELVTIAAESMNTVLQSKLQGELTKLFSLARYAGGDFKLAGIPEDCACPKSSMLFEPAAMRAMFDSGYRGGRDGSAWHSYPPGLEAEMMARPRTDTRFATAENAALVRPRPSERLAASAAEAESLSGHPGRTEASDRR